MASITWLTGSATASYSASGSSTSATSTTSTETQAATAQQQEETVKLSSAAQAKLLHQQGQSVTAIAASLGTTTKQVNDYLGITLQAELTKTLEATTQAAS
jgi:hypothetical protein